MGLNRPQQRTREVVNSRLLPSLTSVESSLYMRLARPTIFLRQRFVDWIILSNITPCHGS